MLDYQNPEFRTEPNGEEPFVGYTTQSARVDTGIQTFTKIDIDYDKQKPPVPFYKYMTYKRKWNYQKCEYEVIEGSGVEITKEQIMTMPSSVNETIPVGTPLYFNSDYHLSEAIKRGMVSSKPITFKAKAKPEVVKDEAKSGKKVLIG